MSDVHAKLLALADEYANSGAPHEHRQREYDALSAALREVVEDAERWRYWRSTYAKQQPIPSIVLGMNDEDQLDAAIDSARSTK